MVMAKISKTSGILYDVRIVAWNKIVKWNACLEKKENWSVPSVPDLQCMRILHNLWYALDASDKTNISKEKCPVKWFHHVILYGWSIESTWAIRERIMLLHATQSYKTFLERQFYRWRREIWAQTDDGIHEWSTTVKVRLVSSIQRQNHKRQSTSIEIQEEPEYFL